MKAANNHESWRATLLSDGCVLTEQAALPELRARAVAKLLTRAGLDAGTLHVEWSNDSPAADGSDDWRARRTVVRVEVP